jgi:hypothetical protein
LACHLASSQAGPFASKAEERRCPNPADTRSPNYLEHSCREARDTFLKALDDAVRTHGKGDQANRIAYTALKRDFEKRGDHWIAKHNPAA